MRSFGRPARMPAQSGLPIVADYEYVPTPGGGALFVPMRLVLPYGVWTAADGAKVLFSRDYKSPLAPALGLRAVAGRALDVDQAPRSGMAVGRGSGTVEDATDRSRRDRFP